jgi:hypothetical protein
MANTEVQNQQRAYEMGLLLGKMGARSRDINAARVQELNGCSDEEVICHLNGIDDAAMGYQQ